jgi:predicted N-acetyltransferase YhbS
MRKCLPAVGRCSIREDPDNQEALAPLASIAQPLEAHIAEPNAVKWHAFRSERRPYLLNRIRAGGSTRSRCAAATDEHAENYGGRAEAEHARSHLLSVGHLNAQASFQNTGSGERLVRGLLFLGLG